MHRSPAPLTDPIAERVSHPKRGTAPAARKLRLLVAGGVAALVGLLLYLGLFPCAFATVFGVPCPGCGSTRAVRALLEGDVHGAVLIHPVAPFTAALLAALVARAVLGHARGEPSAALGTSRFDALLLKLLLVCAIASLALWLLRFGGLFGGPVPVR